MSILIYDFLVVVQQDSYHTTGCFDLTCKGFVQIASDIALGSTVGPYSSQFNQQYEINVGIFWVMITYYSHISIELYSYIVSLVYKRNINLLNCWLDLGC